MAVYPLWQADVPEESAEEIERRKKQLADEIDACGEVQGSYRNKVKKFLEEQGIWHISEIDYLLRVKYEEFLKTEVSPVSWNIYLKGFDRIKQHSVREQIQTLKGKRNTLTDLEDQIIFLPYHPEQEIAGQFGRLVKTDNLVWNFSQKAPRMLKKQIFDVLHFMLRQGMSKKDRSDYLTALKRLYEFCIKEQVADIESLELRQIDKFRDSIQYWREQDFAMRILEQSRKILFVESDEVYWNANVWYLDRFHFERARVNPTSPVQTISFIEVTDKENRKYLQQYMKYCLGVTHLAISNIQSEFNRIRSFVVWLEKNHLQGVRDVSEDTVDRYFRYQERNRIKEETFNKTVRSILHFYDYLKVKRIIKKIPFCEQYYLKKTMPEHHDRSVGEEVYAEMILKLKYFPEDLRLMFLHLWGIGLRASEVCSLKGDAYYLQGKDAWIQVYQIKRKDYKRIPIPWAIYKLMEVYLEKYRISRDDYIFQNKKGGAYSYSSFRYRMLKYCEKNQIGNGEYLFKSHDYRHHVATMYYDNEVSIQSVRDYLGHDYEEMTRQYIDYMPQKISRANEEYFKQEEYGLASGIKRCKRGK